MGENKCDARSEKPKNLEALGRFNMVNVDGLFCSGLAGCRQYGGLLYLNPHGMLWIQMILGILRTFGVWLRGN